MARQRWTDEMVDGLASSVHELREGMTELRGTVTELREGMTELRGTVTELREGMTDVKASISEIKDSVDGLRVTSQALLQIAAQHQQEMELIKERQAESDARFNVLLEEVRYLIRRERDD